MKIIKIKRSMTKITQNEIFGSKISKIKLNQGVNGGISKEIGGAIVSKHHEKEKLITIEMAKNFIGKKRSSADDDKKEPPLKRKNTWKRSNDEGMSSNSNEPEHFDAAADSLIDEIKEEPMDDDENFCIGDLIELPAQKRNSNWQQLGVEIVREDPDSDEFVKEEPQFYDEQGNEIYEYDSFDTEQDTNCGTLAIKGDEVVDTPDEKAPAGMKDDGAMITKFRAIWKKILFGNYYQITEMKGKDLTVECKSCKTTLKDSVLSCQNALYHLKSQHPEVETKYQKEVKLGRYEAEDIGDENEIKVEFKENSTRILFNKYYKLIATTEDSVTAVCRNCKLIEHCKDRTFSTFRKHLRKNHPKLYETYITDLQQKINIIETEFTANFKRVLFKNYFRILSKTNDNIKVSCKLCTSVLNSPVNCSSIIQHLKRKHPAKYVLYRQETKQCRYEPEEVGDENTIEVEFGNESNRILFKNYYKIIANDQDGVKAVCRSCKRIQNCRYGLFHNFPIHLKKRHPDEYEKYHEEVNTSKNLNEQTDVNVEKRIKAKLKRRAFRRRLLETNFRIIEENEDELRVICKHCKLHMMTYLSNNNFQSHLKNKHAEIHEKYLRNINYLEYEKPKVERKSIVKRGFRTDKKESKLVDIVIESESKRRRNSETPNDGGITLNSIESQPTDTTVDWLIEEIEEEPIVEEIEEEPIVEEIEEEPIVEEIDMNELFGIQPDGFQTHIQYGQTSDWQRDSEPNMGVEIIREEPDPDEFVKEETQFYDEQRNEIDGNQSSTIEHNQGIVDDGKFGIKDNEIVYPHDEGALAHMPNEDATKIEFNVNWKKIFIGNYHRIIETDGNELIVECKSCKWVVNDSVSCANSRQHMKRNHPELYEKYKEEVRQYKLRDIKPMDDTNTKIEFSGNYKTILFKKYFKILSKTKDIMSASCKRCKQVFMCGPNCSSLADHLRNRHRDDFRKYQEQLKRCRNEPEDEENAIEADFKLNSDRILMNKYYKVIDKTEDSVTVLCRTCKHIQYSSLKSLKNFRRHLRERHPYVNEEYKKEVQQSKPHQLDIGVEEETIPTDSLEISFEKHFRIIKNNKDELRVGCIHCDLVMRGSLSSNLFRNHLKIRHAEKLIAVNTCTAEVSMDKQSQSIDEMMEPQLKRKRISKSPNDERTTVSFIEFEHNYAASNFLIDKIKEEPIVEELDMDELIDEVEQGQSSNGQRQRVEIVREEPDPDEFVKEEPQFYDEYARQENETQMDWFHECQSQTPTR